MAEGPRLRPTTNTTTTTSPHTEATPIAAASQRSNDYAAISPVSSRDAAPAGHHAPNGSTIATASAAQGNAPEPAADEAPRSEARRWSEFWDKWGSVELENRGSVARDHLALERTFLAWLRTSLSFASIGIAITQLFRLNSSLRSDTSSSSSSSSSSSATIDINAAHSHSLHKLRHLGKPLGATFIAFSILMLLIGFHRYFEAQHYVIRGKFPASRGSIVVVSLVAGGLIVSSLGVILGTAPDLFET